MVTLREQQAIWLKQLKEAGVFAPAFELRELLRHVTGLTLTQQLMQADMLPPAPQLAEMNRLLAQRCGGRPLQYILGQWEFYGLEFYVGEGVLIPRADTETLVDVGLALCKGLPQPSIADLCSGSGCIAVALAHNLPHAAVAAVELSANAYNYLQRNVAANSAQNITTLHADALACAGAFCGLDLIVSNPPYIRTGDLAGLQREVQCEPSLALDGTADGLYFYREISSLYKKSLKPGGWLAFEAGDDQSADIREILRQNGYSNITTHKDLAGYERVVCGRRATPACEPPKP